MRQLTDHISNPVNDRITIEVLDAPGAGGAPHEYALSYTTDDGQRPTYVLHFQHGGIAERGVTGITNEALLAVLIDRLAGFQAGPFPSDTNASALEHCRQALMALQERTRERLARGVEGATRP